MRTTTVACDGCGGPISDSDWMTASALRYSLDDPGLILLGFAPPGTLDWHVECLRGFLARSEATS